MLDHLKARGMNPYLYMGASTDGKTVTFPLYNFGGKRTGYMRYRPEGSKEKNNAANGRYFTYITPGEVGVFGLESLENPGPIFLTGGMFKAATLHRLGYAALHVSSVSPRDLRPQLRLLNRPYFAIGDNDAEGAQFARRWGGWQSPVDVDEMEDGCVRAMITVELANRGVYG